MPGWLGNPQMPPAFITVQKDPAIYLWMYQGGAEEGMNPIRTALLQFYPDDIIAESEFVTCEIQSARARIWLRGSSDFDYGFMNWQIFVRNLHLDGNLYTTVDQSGSIGAS